MEDMPNDLSTWDERMMEQFIRENAAAFRLFASRLMDSGEDVDDVLQEAYIKLWTNRQQIGVVSSPRNYFYSILKNTIADYRDSSWKRLSSRLEGREVDVLDGGELEQHVIEVESARLIADAIAQLSPQAQKVMLMTLEERRMQEIAEELGVTLNTVKTIKYRALKRLSELLSPEDFLFLLSLCSTLLL